MLNPHVGSRPQSGHRRCDRHPCPTSHKVASDRGFPEESNLLAEERLQLRLAAILAADVVGYSRLMGIDEIGTLKRLKTLRRGLIDPAIAAHAGRIVKLMGDGVLV